MIKYYKLKCKIINYHLRTFSSCGCGDACGCDACGESCDAFHLQSCCDYDESCYDSYLPFYILCLDFFYSVQKENLGYALSDSL